MIRINLLGEKVDNTVEHFLQISWFAIAVIITVATCVVLQSSTQSEFAKLQASERQLEKELSELKKVTKEVAGLELKRKDLRDKLHVIANLKAKKRGPIRVLDDLNTALPERAWVLSLREQEGKVEITGLALDNQTIAEFMLALEESEYFGTVDLVHSTQSNFEQVKLQQFSLMAQITNPHEVKQPEVTPTVATNAANKSARSTKKPARI